MSFNNSNVPEDEARISAEKHLRLEIGNLPHLGEMKHDEGQYEFPIEIAIPSVIFEKGKTGPEPVEVQFMSDINVGKIIVDSQSGEVVDATEPELIDERINARKSELEDEVKRALIRTAADDLSLLPYPIHRQTPVVEVLSHLLTNEEVEERRLRGLKEKYDTHISTLIDAGLITRKGAFLEPTDPLKKIREGEGKLSDRLNDAMAYMFQQKADDLEFMNEFLGPYLDVAGYYYWRALESETLPEVSINEFQEVLAKDKTGRQADVREFQAARYLIQLEQVGLLNISTEYGERTWVGDKSIRDQILQSGDWGEFGIITA